jgi:hypothetical protein
LRVWSKLIQFHLIHTSGYTFQFDAGCLLFRDDSICSGDLQTRTKPTILKSTVYTTTKTFAYWDYGIELSRRFSRFKGLADLAATTEPGESLKLLLKILRWQNILATWFVMLDDFELLARLNKYLLFPLCTERFKESPGRWPSFRIE